MGSYSKAKPSSCKAKTKHFVNVSATKDELLRLTLDLLGMLATFWDKPANLIRPKQSKSMQFYV